MPKSGLKLMSMPRPGLSPKIMSSLQEHKPKTKVLFIYPPFAGSTDPVGAEDREKADQEQYGNKQATSPKSSKETTDPISLWRSRV